MQKHLANIVTIIGIILGITAIVFALQNNHIYAMILILASALIDRYDGIIARKLNTVSRLGSILDTTNDVVSFSISPAILLYTTNLFFLPLIMIIVIVIYLVSSLFRLYRFHKESNTIDYKGLPITIGATLIVLVLAWFIYIDQVNLYSDIIMLAITSFIAYAMACTMTVKKR